MEDEAVYEVEAVEACPIERYDPGVGAVICTVVGLVAGTVQYVAGCIRDVLVAELEEDRR